MKEGIIQKKRYRILVVIAIIVMSIIYLFRVAWLDADNYSYAVSQIQPIDEKYYNEFAYKIGDNGLLFSLAHGVGKITLPNSKTFFFPQLFTALVQRVMGKNYYSLRAVSVISGFFSLLCTAGILTKLITDKKKAAYASFFAIVVMLFDFSVMLYTRSAITIAPCMLAEVLFAYMIIKSKSSSKKSGFYLGFIPILSFCTVYMGMCYLILAGAIILIYTIIVNWKQWGWVESFVMHYILGLFAGAICSEIISLSFFRQHVQNTVLDTFGGFNSKIHESLNSSIGTYRENAKQFFLSYMFQYNKILQILCILSIAIFCIRVVKRKAEIEEIVLFSVAFSHWLMTVVVINATFSKATMSYCIILCLSAYYLFYYMECLAKRNTLGKRICYLGVGIMLLISISQGCLLSYRYIYSNLSFTDKMISEDIGNIVKDNYTIGGFPLGFAWYNSIDPGFGYYNRYDSPWDQDYVMSQYKLVVTEHEPIYYIGYDNGELDEINRRIEGTGRTLRVLKTYERKYFNYKPGDANMILAVMDQ